MNEARTSILLKTDDRFVAYLNLNTPSTGNYMAFLLQRAGAYLLLARTRVYLDSVIGRDSIDRRAGVAAELMVTTDDEAFIQFALMADTLQEGFTSIGGPTTRNLHRFERGDAAEMIEVLRADPCIHIDPNDVTLTDGLE